VWSHCRSLFASGDAELFVHMLEAVFDRAKRWEQADVAGGDDVREAVSRCGDLATAGAAELLGPLPDWAGRIRAKVSSGSRPDDPLLTGVTRVIGQPSTRASLARSTFETLARELLRATTSTLAAAEAR